MNTLLISLILYLVALFFIVTYLSKQSVDSFFVNRRQTHLGVMTMSLIATVLGTGSTVVVISEVYHSGISYGLAFLISSTTGMLVLAACAKEIKTFGDIYKTNTIPDFFGRRFSRQMKRVTAVLLLLSIFLIAAVQMTAVSTLLATAFDMPYWAALFVVGTITLVYTTIGGFRFDLLTDFVNGWSLLFLLALVAVMSGFYMTNHNLTTIPESFSNPVAYAGPWWFIGTIILAGFGQVANASQWQRIMSAANVGTVERAFKLAIPIILILGATIVFLGIASHQIAGPGLPQERALFSLIEALVPGWLAGVIFAIMIAVFITSLDNQIIAGSAIIFGLLYQRHDLSEKVSILNARLITAVVAIVGFLIAMIHPHLVRFQSFSTHIALILGPIIVATLFTTNKKSNEALFWAITVPFITLCVLYPFMKSSTFLVTTPLTLILLKYYDRWTSPIQRVYK